MATSLFERDSLLDLYGRGFPHRVLSDRFGKASVITREQRRAIDPAEYQLAFVAANFTREQAEQVMAAAEAGADKVTLRQMFGLAGKHGANVGDIFGVFGMAERWVETSNRTRISKGRKTSLARYGAASVFEREDGQELAKAGVRAKFGVDNVFQSEKVKAKIRRENKKRYGVEYTTQRADVIEKIRSGAVERYGIDWPTATEGHKAACRATNLAKRGVEFPTQCPEVRAKAVASKNLRGTFHTSSSEVRLKELLIEVFGEDDVLTQHWDERYPFACDFYIRSRDLFVELNATWTHGGHWYGSGSQDDDVVAAWSSKQSDYYDSAVLVWTDSDVRKRAAARRAGLNYVVLWDHYLGDTELWFALGAPDGRDWEREHSWLPDRELVLDLDFPKELTKGSAVVRKAAKAANARSFYRREVEMWEQDAVHPKWGRTRAALLANRLRYLGKEPATLSDVEIARGFGISGILRSWTSFDNSAMVQVLEEHQPSKVYDPCAGWGERMATCAAMGVGYRGLDINPEVVTGHGKIAARYGLVDQSSRVGDAASTDAREGDHEMVLTCPPYGDAEVYTETGAENLDEAGFVEWWQAVVELSVSPSTKVFAYQINQRWKDRMNAVLVAAGWELAEQIEVGTNRVSHLNRGPDGKSKRKEYEEMQVFVKKKDGEL